MEPKEVVLTITGVHAGNTDETIGISCQGKHTTDDGIHFISYQEVVDESGATLDCAIRFTSDWLEMTRGKDANISVMRFCTGEKYSSMYNTEYGALDIVTDTRQYEMVENEDSIDIMFNYTLHINMQFASECTMTIKVRT